MSDDYFRTTRVDRIARIAARITSAWPHRMSRSAAQAIDANYLRDLQDEVREVNLANGWFEESRTVGDDVALLHSEVSEMLEAFRAHGLEDVTARTYAEGTLPKPEGFGSECADVLIRLLDTCDRRGIDLHAEFVRKLAHNRTRGRRHGGKRL